MGSSATSYQATDTSGFVTLDTDQTITGEKTFNANLISTQRLHYGPEANNVYSTGLAQTLLTFLGTSGAEPFLNQTIASVRGINDMFHQFNPGVGRWAYLESWSSAGLVIGTGNADTPVEIRPNRSLTADFTDNGTQLATGGTGGTRIAKLRTEKATMAAGTTGVIADTPVGTTSVILVTPEFLPAGRLYYTISAGVGFTILSTDAGDAGSVSWQRVTV